MNRAYFLLPLLVIIPSVCSLQCYECDSRKQSTSCENATVVDCKDETEICFKYTYESSEPGVAVRTTAQCKDRLNYAWLLNSCQLHVKVTENEFVYVSTETCICDSDLCNDSEFTYSSMLNKRTEIKTEYLEKTADGNNSAGNSTSGIRPSALPLAVQLAAVGVAVRLRL